ncbi:hypothetical protein [Rhodoferax sp.]|uniref:hypothetical protein n=2 Tax=Rhodoferax sp. TaxID=50421 RepID=UPI00271BCA7B|nr:hypothetical protein [Rhodoferax sp.]MDO8320990.1 hypothetical protein [Rhodoferax sp.]MDP2680349.1 hypothetical protein [Rhodoferax sp.]
MGELCVSPMMYIVLDVKQVFLYWLTRRSVCSAADFALTPIPPYAHTRFFTTEVAQELADVLIASAPPGMRYAYFASL